MTKFSGKMRQYAVDFHSLTKYDHQNCCPDICHIKACTILYYLYLLVFVVLIQN